MSSTKVVTSYFLFANNEATYGSGAVITGSLHTIRVVEDFPIFNLDFLWDGNRNGGGYSGGNIRRSPPNGKQCSGKVKLEIQGLGTAYASSSVGTVPNLHPFLLASGLSASLNGTTWVYKPLPMDTADSSLGLQMYDRKECLNVSGAYCTFTITGEGGGIGYFEFDVKGLPSAILDYSSSTSIPARVWRDTVAIPPKLEALSLTIGSYTPVVKKFTYEHNLEIFPRLNLNTSSSHAGFGIGRRDPTFKLTIEADAQATYDPYADWANGTSRTLAFQIGQVGNNRFAVSMSQAILTKCERTAEDKVATFDLEFKPFVSQSDTSDDVQFIFL